MISDTPPPPYYAVIFTSIKGLEAGEDYAEMAREMDALVKDQQGDTWGMSPPEIRWALRLVTGRAWRPSLPGKTKPAISSLKTLARKNGTKPIKFESAK